jgi:hypothetical protein
VAKLLSSCVADASSDIMNEQIIELAGEIDSSRKVGVFTKCDKTDTPNDVSKVVSFGKPPC